MSNYLKFFELEQSPFEGKAQSQVVLGTRALRDAFGTIRSGLEEGASRICVSGGPGVGKTSLARALPKLLGNDARVALVLDPTVSWEASRDSLARQWGIPDGRLSRAALVTAAAERRLILTIDQAERASEELLDHLDVVLSYRTADDQPVVQSVLLARLATQHDEGPSPLVWWLDRIQTLQLEFAPMPRDGVEFYIQKHLKRAGWRGDHLFDEAAAHAIHEFSGGVPGDISRLCEQLLVEAAARDLGAIDADFVRSICEPAAAQGEPEPASTVDDTLNKTVDNTGNTDDDDIDADDTDDVMREDVAELAAASPASDPDPERTSSEACATTEPATEAWTLPDEFERLAMEDEFAEAAGIRCDSANEIDPEAQDDAGDGDTHNEDEDEPTQNVDESEARYSVDTPDEAPAGVELTDAISEESTDANLATALEFFEAAAAAATPEDERDADEDPSEANDEMPANGMDAASAIRSLDPTDECNTYSADDTGDTDDVDGYVGDVSEMSEAGESDPFANPAAELSPIGDAFAATPESEAELLEIHGSAFSRLVRPFAFAAIAALLGGIAFSFLNGAAPVAPSKPPTRMQAATQNAAGKRAQRPIAVRETEFRERADAASTPVPLVLFRPAAGFVTLEANANADTKIAEAEVQRASVLITPPRPADIPPADNADLFPAEELAQAAPSPSRIDAATHSTSVEEANPEGLPAEITLSGVDEPAKSGVLDPMLEEYFDAAPAAPSSEATVGF